MNLVIGATTAMIPVQINAGSVPVGAVGSLMDIASTASEEHSYQAIVLYHVVTSGRIAKCVVGAIAVCVNTDFGAGTATRIAPQVVMNAKGEQVTALYVYLDCGGRTAQEIVQVTTASVV